MGVSEAQRVGKNDYALKTAYTKCIKFVPYINKKCNLKSELGIMLQHVKSPLRKPASHTRRLIWVLAIPLLIWFLVNVSSEALNDGSSIWAHVPLLWCSGLLDLAWSRPICCQLLVCQAAGRSVNWTVSIYLSSIFLFVYHFLLSPCSLLSNSASQVEENK